MKKILPIITISYLVIIGVIFYIFFGPGYFNRFEPMKWKDIEINVPKNYKIRTYENKGWETYSLQKIFELIRISRKVPAVDVSGFSKHKYAGKVIYQASPYPDSIYYISNIRKTYEVVFAFTIDDITFHVCVTNASVFSATRLMEKMMAGCYYKGQKITLPKQQIPLRAYITDIIFLVGMIIPLIIILVLFSLSAKKPASKYFQGDPIHLEESNVSFTRGQGYRRKNMFCYLVLTASRLMIFSFGKPVIEFSLHKELPDIKFEGKKIIIQSSREKFVLRPADIEKWRSALASYLK
jgi:hypothetical protein